MTNTEHKQPPIEINEQFRHALDIMEDSDRSIFITGRAGTGKSTLLNLFRRVTKKKVAVLAPTSLTLATDQSFLSSALVKAILADPKATLGQTFLRAQRQVPADEPGTRDVMKTFLLFGDPALRLVSAQ